MLPVLWNGTSLAPAARETAPAHRISSLFERFLGDDGLFGSMTRAPGWTTLPLSMWEDEGHVYVEADLPGLTEKDIELSVQGQELVVSGERKYERKASLYEGRCYGRFEQRVTLPVDVEADKVEARLANGVLQICLPKSPEHKPRKIEIKG
jgi:HSP20 family protein